jgi:hypothetical protein
MSFVHNIFKRTFGQKKTRAMSKDNLLRSIYVLRSCRKTAYHAPILISSNESRLMANGRRTTDDRVLERQTRIEKGRQIYIFMSESDGGCHARTRFIRGHLTSGRLKIFTVLSRKKFFLGSKLSV